MTAQKRQTPSAQADGPTVPLAISASAEDYLKAVYGLERAGSAATTNELARLLGIAAPSVSGMIRRLADQGLLSHEPYHGVALTDAGRFLALRTLRRHRVIEAYLAKALGYPWDRVHAEAERLEHAASDELIDRMAAAVGDPQTDPHGAPIPARDGTVDEQRYRSLAELEVGESARVVRVADEDSAMLQYLGELGLVPGATVQVDARAPFEGPITVRVGRAAHHIGAGLAGQIRVR